jgi:hypothetical protein
MAVKPRKKPAYDGPTISAAGSSPQKTIGRTPFTVSSTPTKKKPARRGGGSSGSSGGTRAPTPVGPTPAPPLDPLAPLSPAQMMAQASQMAQQQIMPGIQDVTRQQQQAQMAHDTRDAQNQGWATWAQGNLDSAFTDTRNALNNLIGVQGGVDQNSKDALAAALRSGTGTTDQAAQMLGVASPTDLAPTLGSLAEGTKNAELGVNSGSGALLGLAGANRALPSVGLAQGNEVERQRFNAVNQDFNQKRTDLNAQIPGLVQASLKDQRDFELSKAQFGEQKANDLFQQYLADKELNLKSKDQTFQQWLARAQLKETTRSNKATEGLTAAQQKSQAAIDWANVGINRTQAEGTLAQIRQDAAKEKDAKKKEALKARGEAVAKGLEWLSGYMAPAKGQSTSTHSNYPYGAAGEGAIKDNPDDPSTLKDNTSEYKRTFDEALRGLTNYMSRSDALRILKKSEYSDWRDRANQYYARMKRRPGMGAAGYSKGGGRPD